MTRTGLVTTATVQHALTPACPATGCCAVAGAIVNVAAVSVSSQAPMETPVRSVPPAQMPAHLRSEWIVWRELGGWKKEEGPWTRTPNSRGSILDNGLLQMNKYLAFSTTTFLWRSWRWYQICRNHSSTNGSKPSSRLASYILLHGEGVQTGLLLRFSCSVLTAVGGGTRG